MKIIDHLQSVYFFMIFGPILFQEKNFIQVLHSHNIQVEIL